MQKEAKGSWTNIFDPIVKPFTEKAPDIRGAQKTVGELKEKLQKLVALGKKDPGIAESISQHGKEYRTARATLKNLVDKAAKIKLRKQQLMWGIPASIAAAGLAGGGYALLRRTMGEKDPAEKRRKAIARSLAIQELQSPTATEEDVFGKMSKEAAADFPLKQLLAIGAAGTAGLAAPTYYLSKDLEDYIARKKVKENVTQLKNLQKKYDQHFRQAVLQDLNIDPRELAQEAKIIGKEAQEKTASVAARVTDIIRQHGYPIAAGLAGTGLGTAAFLRGMRDVESSSGSLREMNRYRDMLNKIIAMRHAPVILTEGPFTPEEMVAIQRLRRETPVKKAKKKKADMIKDTKGGTKPVSAEVDDPALQELLQSV